MALISRTRDDLFEVENNSNITLGYQLTLFGVVLLAGVLYSSWAEMATLVMIGAAFLAGICLIPGLTIIRREWRRTCYDSVKYRYTTQRPPSYCFDMPNLREMNAGDQAVLEIKEKPERLLVVFDGSSFFFYNITAEGPFRQHQRFIVVLYHGNPWLAESDISPNPNAASMPRDAAITAIDQGADALVVIPLPQD